MKHVGKLKKLLMILLMVSSWALFNTAAQAATGTVSLLSDPEGHGRILGDDGVEYFVHADVVHSSGLHEGEKVSFQVATGTQGPIAHSVKAVEG